MIENGKKIEFITFEDIDGFCIHRASETRTLEYQSEDCGDHGENWVVVKDNGIETSRYNVKFIQTICWEQEGKTC